ncbi:MAG: hypothetical protein OES38_09515 [Gammaproteobacteria bacterium]|nr:hypothetical protein [Gammaproteobacteria bacterium]
MLAAAAVFLLGACSEPFIVFSGGELRGEISDAPSDWSQFNAVDTVQLETQPDDPYSINVWATGIGPDVYVATGDDDTNWTKHIEAHRDVRLRIEQQVFELKAIRVRDPDELQRVSAAYVDKYGLETDDNWVMTGQVFRLDRR